MSHGRSMSGLGYFAGVWCGGQWSEARPDTPPSTQQGQSWNSVISESTLVLLLLRLCALQRTRQTQENDFTKWRDENNLAHLPPPPPATASTWPCHHILLLSLANLLPKKKERKILVSCTASQPVLSIYYPVFSPLLPFLPLFLHLFITPSRRQQHRGRVTCHWTRRNLA